MATEEEAKQWVTENQLLLTKALAEFEEVPAFMKEPGNRFEAVWFVGCWLNEKLREAGASETEVKNIGFAHGQRCLFGDPYYWAVTYLNEFVESGQVSDEPGKDLADRINDEVFGL